VLTSKTCFDIRRITDADYLGYLLRLLFATSKQYTCHDNVEDSG